MRPLTCNAARTDAVLAAPGRDLDSGYVEDPCGRTTGGYRLAVDERQTTFACRTRPRSRPAARCGPGPGDRGPSAGPEQPGPHGIVDPGTMIGLVGVGRMGLPVCANLVRAGYEVTAYDRRPEQAVAVRATGATWAGSLTEVAVGADVLITVLSGPPEVVEAMTGPDGALASLRSGATWIDMTSNAAAVAAPVQALAVARGVNVLEAPMGGGPDAAADGTLKLFVGGPAGLAERYRALLSAVADPDRLVHVGGLGAGYTTKLLVNLLWFGQAVATAEALLLGRSAGIDLTVLRAAMTDSAAASEFVRHDLDAVFAGDRLASFGLDRCCEELANITAQARALGVPFSLSELVDDVHRRANARYGDVDGELMAIALLEDESGISLRTETPTT